MAGLRPPLPLRRLDGPARPAREAHEGDGAAGPDRVIVTPPLTNTVRTTSTTQRDVTVSGLRPANLRTGGMRMPQRPPRKWAVGRRVPRLLHRGQDVVAAVMGFGLGCVVRAVG